MSLRVLIVAAPFGFGPAAKALLIADALAGVAEVTIFSNRDALRFVNRFKPPGVVSREGVFHAAFPDQPALSAFDCFISINNEPAVHHLIAHGLQARTIFVDSILPWRSMNSPVGFREPILAYLVQDFPGAAAGLHRCHALTVELTAPMVWAQPGTARPSPKGMGSITLHVGGVTSPLVGWDMLKQPIANILECTAGQTSRFLRSLSVIGSRHLASMDLVSTDGVEMLGDISPPETAAVIGASEVLVTTPGIGAIYEALVLGVPVILLPPMNSTQLLQYVVLTQRGFLGSIGGPSRADMLRVARSVPWDQQTGHCVEWLRRNPADALAALPGHLAQLLSTDGGSARAGVLAVQQAFKSELSRNSAVDVIRRLLSKGSIGPITPPKVGG